jgi:predicted secreted acid phosphatase
MNLLSSLRSSSRPGVLAGAGLLVLGVIGGGAAVAATQAPAPTPQPAIKTITPRTEHQVDNIDIVRQQIKNYYGDPLGTGITPEDSNYAKEARKVAASGARYLARSARAHRTSKTKAILLDVDDTTLRTWNYEIFSNFAFSPATQTPFVLEQRFEPVFGMVDLVTAAEREGYAVFFLTGRGAAQEAATLGNLTADGVGVDAGYPKPTALRNGEDGLFTKPAVADYPDYLKAACAADPNGSCTTVHYKSATRKHIESLGYDIVANFGDQYSDLKGGYADKTFKLPNPTYFLP